jgi:competence protein ComEC
MSTDGRKAYVFSALDVGQGNCQLLEEGDEVHILFDCNLKGAPEFVSRYLGRRKISDIDLLILTGTDEDHADADGLRMLARRYTISRVWIPDFPKESDNWNEVKKALKEWEKQGTTVECPQAGNSLEVGTIHLKVLGPHPDDSHTSNNASIVVKATTGEVGFLITGDCENERWDSILNYFKKWLPSEVLVVPHHGSDHGCSEQVIKVVNPLYSVVSVGEGNKYDHPDDDALAIYRRLTRRRVFLTKDHGSILFECDGHRITNVITDAGQDADGIKKRAGDVAAALTTGSPIFISGLGTPSTVPGAGVPYRPTHFHGGIEPEAATEDD